MRKRRKQYTDAKRIAWNEVAPRHAAYNNEALFAAAGDPAFVSFAGEILETLRHVVVTGKRIIQLGCNRRDKRAVHRNVLFEDRDDRLSFS
jgi:hypothetical protein